MPLSDVCWCIPPNAVDISTLNPSVDALADQRSSLNINPSIPCLEISQEYRVDKQPLPSLLLLCGLHQVVSPSGFDLHSYVQRLCIPTISRNSLQCGAPGR